MQAQCLSASIRRVRADHAYSQAGAVRSSRTMFLWGGTGAHDNPKQTSLILTLLYFHVELSWGIPLYLCPKNV